MKRLLACALAVMLMLSGCQKQEKSVNISEEDLNCSFSAQMDDFNFSGRLSLPQVGSPTIEITSPSELAGMRLEFIKDAVLITHLGIEIELPNDQYPPLAAGKILFSLLREGKVADGLTTKNIEQGFEITGKSSLGEYKMILDKNRFPLEITAEKIGFRCQFKE